MAMNRILITGAAGTIGQVLRQGLRDHYPVIRLSDITPLGEASTGEELVQADITDAAAIEAAMEGVDGVIHLGAKSVEDTWDNILSVNIAGTYNVFEAARRQGVSRIVFASSNHAIGFYRRDQKLDSNVVPRPDSRYGVSKVFGESLGSLYADKHGIGVMCMRIGSCLEEPLDARHLSTRISPGDMVRLVRAGLDAPKLGFAIVYGASNNTRGWWDHSVACQLGYAPEDDSEDFAEEIMSLEVPEDADDIAKLFQGGVFASAEFDGEMPES